MLHRAKHKNPDAVIVAAGCYVQTKEDEAMADEAIDIIIGNNKKHELLERLEEFFSRREELAQEEFANLKIDAVIDINGEKQEYEELFMDQPSEHTRAFIKVQDGCNQFCSYCIIPYARGRVRSRDLQSVLEEVQRLADNGYQEVVLTGIHLSSYGIENGESLLHLIQEIHKNKQIKRIRLGSLEPKIVTEEFASELSKLDKICPHFHLSLQSGCDATLQRMNRKYSAAEYKTGCEILRKYFEHPAITTDVIVGFPGETEEEFAITKAFLEDIHFYEMHIFKYSKRQGTRAAVMPNQVPEEKKNVRSAELIALGEQMSQEFREDYLTQEVEVLFEEENVIDGNSYYVGYTKEYVKVAKVSEVPLENQFVKGILTQKLSEEIYLMQ
jgi:threonylcarbamoyladenosine tRNA methylthiotransferase MtaB